MEKRKVGRPRTPVSIEVRLIELLKENISLRKIADIVKNEGFTVSFTTIYNIAVRNGHTFIRRHNRRK